MLFSVGLFAAGVVLFVTWKLTKTDASDLLNGSWVVVAGDSEQVSLAFANDDGSGTNVGPVRSPSLFWLGMPKLINSMLNTDEKREKMTDVMWQAYSDELYRSDGMHYHVAVYEAAVHIMLNGLLIESNQKL
ncbi:hypothetical protein HAX54_009434 [Datura stramonium]|uniref:Uncharacterized protein n=1 Tax=Datura stramonium TaxID=4076 RepID=A0ABS8RWW4_DATST|nr:hypothetical protein [Datura stramonium]